MPSLGTKIFTILYGQFVGQDEFGNKYYKDRRHAKQDKERRWVLFAGDDEATSVPPGWFGWLHNTDTLPPTEILSKVRSWEKPHRPNPTGTEKAYLPPGHVLGDGQRERATGDYESWNPEE